MAILVLLYLHRRHMKKLRSEDTNEKYKSLDFGMNNAGSGAGKKSKANKKLPEMTVTDPEKMTRKERGLSMDLDVGSPYILPPNLHGSRESLHSMSRSMGSTDDPYRPVALAKDDSSLRSARKAAARPDAGSVRSESTAATDGMQGSLLRNAQRMSQSLPLRAGSVSPLSDASPEEKALPAPPPKARSPPRPPPLSLRPGTKGSLGSASPKDAHDETWLGAAVETGPVGGFAAGSALPHVERRAVGGKASPSPPLLPRVASQEAMVQDKDVQSLASDSSYGHGLRITAPSPPRSTAQPTPVPREQPPARPRLGVDEPGKSANRLSMSLRPLPPDENSENPEERANRIRSFYKEYFDESKPDPRGGHDYVDYYEDHGSEFLDGAIFDPQTGHFVVAQKPHAEPVTRRAMTPPPRAPPRFQGGPGHFSGGSSGGMPSRGQSAMSGRMAGPRKPLPPPTDLFSLPTPHRLKDDMIFNSIDFAPPVSYRERQAGKRPDSPLGAARPYSPAVRPHTPLYSSFDDMASMPSPYVCSNADVWGCRLTRLQARAAQLERVHGARLCAAAAVPRTGLARVRRGLDPVQPVGPVGRGGQQRAGGRVPRQPDPQGGGGHQGRARGQPAAQDEPRGAGVGRPLSFRLFRLHGTAARQGHDGRTTTHLSRPLFVHV